MNDLERERERKESSQEEKKQQLRKWYRWLPARFKTACKQWAELEQWDTETWIDTLNGLSSMFDDFTQAAEWIEQQVLANASLLKPITRIKGFSTNEPRLYAKTVGGAH